MKFRLGFPCASAGKESASNAGDLASNSGLGRSAGEGNSYPFQYSGLENSMGSLLLSPGFWCAQDFVCALQESLSPSPVKVL